MDDDLTKLRDALNEVPAQDRARLVNRLLQIVKRGRVKPSPPSVTEEHFVATFKLMAGLMGWQVDFDTGRFGTEFQRKYLDTISSAWKAALPYQENQLERFGKTSVNYPVIGAEAVQRMFLEKVEKAEKDDELELLKAGRIPHEQTFVLRYIKALILNTCYERPFRMTSGVASFLYGYEYHHFLQMYLCVMQGRDLEYRDERRYEQNWREHIRNHLKYVRKRFGKFLAVQDEDARWKDFKEVQEQGANVVAAVKEGLRLLLPWESSDRLPPGFGSADTSIPFFAEVKRGEFERSVVGRERRRALIDQNIITRIADALGCPLVSGKFVIPRLNKMNKPNTHPPKLDNLPGPDDGLFNEFGRLNKRHVERLESIRPSRLLVRVDEERRGPVHNVDGRTTLNVVITSDDRVVEVFALDENEEVSLGAILPHAHGAFDDPDAQKSKVLWRLPNGRKIVARLAPSPDASYDENGIASRLDLSVSYDPPPLWRRLIPQVLSGSEGHRSLVPVRGWLVGGGLAAAVVIVAVLVASQLNIGPFDESQIVKTIGTPQPSVNVNASPEESQLPTPTPEIVESRDTPEPTPSVDGSGLKKPGQVEGPRRVVVEQQPRRKGKDGTDQSVRGRDASSEEEFVLAVLNDPRKLTLDEGANPPSPLLPGDTRSTAPTTRGPAASPNGTYVKTYRPKLLWSPIEGATIYIVTLRDSKDRQVDGGQTARPEWETRNLLTPDEFYRWEVQPKMGRGENIDTVIKGAFSTLDARTREKVERDEQKYSGSHLRLGISYFRAGLFDDAEREFRLLAEEDPATARRLLRRVLAAKQGER